MPHRRTKYSKRKFKDGEYWLMSSHSTPEERDSQLRRYRKVNHRKLRYIKGEDGRYHIYEKLED
jgi:ribosomal protein S6